MKKLLLLLFMFFTIISFSQTSKEMIGKPIKIGNLLVAENDFPFTMNWDDAKKSCIELGKGWRLPSKSELYSIYKNKNKIGGFGSDTYWTSKQGSNDGLAWVLRFGVGQQIEYDKTDSYYVRAVKSL